MACGRLADGLLRRGRYMGSTLAAHLWCKACRHHAEPDVAQLVKRYGANLPLPEWSERLVCSACGSREVDFVVSGGRR